MIAVFEILALELAFGDLQPCFGSRPANRNRNRKKKTEKNGRKIGKNKRRI